jgi:signal transduction histidine kinase
MTFFTTNFSEEERVLTDGPQELLLELEYQRIARLERIVAHQKEEMRQHQELLKQYLHLNSHNVRGPLVQILGLVNLLKNSPESEGKEVLLGCL